MRYDFTATEVSFVEETFDGAYPNVLVGGFRGVPGVDGYPTKYLMLQRSTDPDDPEDEGPNIEWCDQINSCYDCATSVELTRNSFKILFEENADFCLDIDNEEDELKLTELIIAFEIDKEEFSKLVEQLKNIIFRNCKYFSYREDAA